MYYDNLLVYKIIKIVSKGSWHETRIKIREKQADSALFFNSTSSYIYPTLQHSENCEPKILGI